MIIKPKKVLITMSLIISTNKKGLFGINGSLAFQSKADLNNFSKLTKAFGNVVMGSNTYKSLPENMKPLPDRLNIVLSKIQNLYKALLIQMWCVFLLLKMYLKL